MKLLLIKLVFTFAAVFGLHLSVYAAPDLANGKKLIRRNATPATLKNLASVMAI